MSEPQPAPAQPQPLPPDTKMIDYMSGIKDNLKVPKGQKNKFGGYMYRSCEDILQALKPLLMGGVITFNDFTIVHEGHLFNKSVATITSPFGVSFSVQCEVLFDTHKKGMDGNQITGATMSYGHKYCLQSMFMIDSTDDADTRDNTNNLIDDTKARIAATASEQGLKEIYQQVVGFFERGAITEDEKTALIDFMRLRKDAFNIPAGV